MTLAHFVYFLYLLFIILNKYITNNYRQYITIIIDNIDNFVILQH